MRYGRWGGVGPQAREKREQVRLRAARMFAEGMDAHEAAGGVGDFHEVGVHVAASREPKGFGEDHFAALLDATHQQLGAPILLAWDGLPAHKSATMRALIAARRWLRVYQLPGYAPELNPIENAWSSLNRAMTNLAPGGIADLARITKNRLKSMQYQPALIDGFLNATGLHPP
jgi:hypothetical protein